MPLGSDIGLNYIYWTTNNLHSHLQTHEDFVVAKAGNKEGRASQKQVDDAVSK